MSDAGLRLYFSGHVAALLSTAAAKRNCRPNVLAAALLRLAVESGMEDAILDGDDPEQLAWATRRYASTKAKLILVRGAPLELMKARQRRFYFDQGGSLVKHFGIRAVPATVEQQGRLLIITEQPVRAKERASS